MGGPEKRRSGLYDISDFGALVQPRERSLAGRVKCAAAFPARPLKNQSKRENALLPVPVHQLLASKSRVVLTS